MYEKKRHAADVFIRYVGFLAVKPVQFLVVKFDLIINKNRLFISE